MIYNRLAKEFSYALQTYDFEGGYAVFGVWGISDVARLCYFGLHSLQHRGQEGAGIVVSQDGNLKGHHGLGLLTDVFKEERQIDGLKGDAAIGHVLYSTDGINGMKNIQPFIFKFYDEELALAHTGKLTNAATLRKELEDEGAIFSSSSDTEILMHLIRRSKKDTLVERVKESLNKVKGAFAYLILTPNELIGALDPNGFRPLSLGQMSNGAYILASETCAFDVVGAKFIRTLSLEKWLSSIMNVTILKNIRKIQRCRLIQWNTSTLHDQIRILQV